MLFRPVNNPSAGQIVGRQLNRYFVSRENLDEVHPHLTGNVRKNAMPVFQLNAEHGIGQRLNDATLNLYGFLFRHKRIPLCLMIQTQDNRTLFRDRYGMLEMGG